MSPRYAELADAIGDATPQVERRLSSGGPIDGLRAVEKLTERLDPAPLDEPRIAGRDMLYSSGTTGRPKGIRPKELTAPLDDAPVIVTPVLRDMLGVGPQDVYLSPAPLYHAAPLRFCLAFHQLGATVVVMERFDPAQALEVIADRRVTATQMVPTMFVRLLRLPEAVRARSGPLEPALRPARRRTVPAGDQAPDDRLVGPDHPRVLRLDRGLRAHLDHERGLAHASRQRRAVR